MFGVGVGGSYFIGEVPRPGLPAERAAGGQKQAKGL